MKNLSIDDKSDTLQAMKPCLSQEKNKCSKWKGGKCQCGRE
jgi:hypothetical protein